MPSLWNSSSSRILSFSLMEMYNPPHPGELIKEAMEELEIEPIITPIRGGTDGARLSFMGLPCPNICTGGENFHGKYEYVCVQSMEKIVELQIKVVGKFLENDY